MQNIRIGIGYDVHAFAKGRDLILGGVKIDHETGLMGHSDADVLVHAIMDSLLGAANLGDIGKFFPDTDAGYKGISSIELLKQVNALLEKNNIRIINIDSVVICERPKIKDFTDKMKANISTALNGLELNRIGIKGTTTEKLGFTGRGEGIAAQAVSLIMM
ncbi:MAG: 2-C-methyl-D-erythritol 2,4-cyclodiphosphate synthase [Spirochaetes bacterium]|nr:2-C-methyl-D-erythritol 2,4-cyclodiphosphate synthase [Spirochaetota bacterium]